MHELSLAAALVEQIETAAKREGAHKVVSLSVVIGALSGVEVEPFEFCFPMAAEGTLAEGARLEIEPVSALVHCLECGEETELEVPVMLCGACGASRVELIRGREFLVRSLEVL